MTFGEWVAVKRATNGLTLRQVAHAAGVSISFLSDLERNRRGCSASAALRIGYALGASRALTISEWMADRAAEAKREMDVARRAEDF